MPPTTSGYPYEEVQHDYQIRSLYAGHIEWTTLDTPERPSTTAGLPNGIS